MKNFVRFLLASSSLVFMSVAHAQTVPGGGGGTPTLVCGDASHALGWTGSAWACQPITGGTATAGAPNLSVQYNLGGAITGVTGATSDGTSLILGDGNAKFTGATSGTMILKAPATGGGTITAPTGTDTLVGRASTDTLTNKTLTSPVLVTPALGTPASGVGTNLTGIPNGALTNSAITIGGQSTSLGGSTTNQGTGAKLQLSTGTTTTNNCVKFDSTGNTVDAGAACGGAAGTVTTTGSPANGNLTKFSGAATVTNTDLTGDITTSGTAATTLATVNANVGTFGDATHCANFTVGAKGLITAAAQSTSCPGASGTVSVTASTPNIVVNPTPGTGTFTIGTTAIDSANSGNSTSYTFLSSDAGTTVRRVATSAQTDTLPTVGTAGFGAGFSMTVCTGPVAGQSQDTISTSSKIAYGATGGAGGLVGSIVVPGGSCVEISDPAGTNYVVKGLSQINVSSTTGSIVNGITGSIIYDNGGRADEVSKTNGGVVSRSAGGTLQESATLPSGINATSMNLTTPALGIPSSGDATNMTNIPVANATGVLLAANGGTGLSALGTGVATALGANVSGSGGICLASGSACAAGTGGGMFNYSDSGVTLTANTYYVSIGGGGAPSTTLADVSIPSPSVTTVNNLSVSISTTLGGASTLFTVTLWKNGATTALTCNFNPSSLKACTDTNAGHAVSIAQGDTLAWQIITTGTIVGTPVVNISANNGTTNAVGVTSIATNNGVTGGTITGTGTIGLAAAAADTYKGNSTSGSAVPLDVAQINCPITGDGYNTATHAEQCATPPVWQKVVSGNYYPFNPQMASTLQGATVLATVIYWTPIYIAQPLSFQKLCTRATVADASNNFQLALYASSASNLITGAPLVSTGNIALSTAPANLCGTASYSVTTPGLYWYGMATNSTTEKFYAYATGTPVLGSVGTATLANMAQGTTTPLFGLGWTTTGVSWAAQVFSGWPTSPTLVEAQAATSQTTVPFYQAN